MQSELVANEDQPAPSGRPAGRRPVLDQPLEAVAARARRARRAAAAPHPGQRAADGRRRWTTRSTSPAGSRSGPTPRDDWARTTVICGLRPGQRLRIVKYLAYGWSSLRSRPALRDQVAAALASARYTGWDGLLDAQRQYLDDFWDSADVEVEGDPDLQQAVRFGLFHVLQASARAERRAIAGKGLTGPGYDGHAFWDTEGFVLPVLTYTVPHAAADALRWRALHPGPGPRPRGRARPAGRGVPVAHHPRRGVLGVLAGRNRRLARQRRHRDGVRALPRRHRRRGARGGVRPGACSSRPRGCGSRSGTTTATGCWHVDGVTGPDEYTAVVRDNVFTNLMAAHNLRTAADACARQPGRRRRAGRRRPRRWRPGATPPTPCTFPYDEELGVHQQCEGFTDLQRVGLRGQRAGSYPLLLHEPYVQLYPAQVVKQADLVLAMHWQSHAFTPEQKARNVDYYERADRARLVAVGVHPGGDVRRGRPPASWPTTTPTRPR